MGGELENDKWEQKLTRTLALSVILFHMLCIVPIFLFSRSPFPVPRSPFPVLVTSHCEACD